MSRNESRICASGPPPLDLSSVEVAVGGAAWWAPVAVRVPVDHGSLVSPLAGATVYASAYLTSMFL